MRKLAIWILFLAAIAAPLSAQRPADAPATAPSGKPPDSVFLEDLTWNEVKDALARGTTTMIIPTGGTEQNGPHIALGKHNYLVRYKAGEIARLLGNALVAPVVAYVPEGDIDPPTGLMRFAGTITTPQEVFAKVLEYAARSLRQHGFLDIALVGDSGGNQAGMTAVAGKLNEEWKDAGVKVFALTDYYEEGRVHYRAWLEAAFGYDDATVGAHAGISDTSQMLHVKPTGVRKEQIKPWGGPQDSGVSGDPAKATAEIGKMGVEFKVNAGIAQYRALKNPSTRGRGRSGGAQG